jgi:hypothetical protein
VSSPMPKTVEMGKSDEKEDCTNGPGRGGEGAAVGAASRKSGSNY